MPQSSRDYTGVLASGYLTNVQDLPGMTCVETENNLLIFLPKQGEPNFEK